MVALVSVFLLCLRVHVFSCVLVFDVYGLSVLLNDSGLMQSNFYVEESLLFELFASQVLALRF